MQGQFKFNLKMLVVWFLVAAIMMRGNAFLTLFVTGFLYWLFEVFLTDKIKKE